MVMDAIDSCGTAVQKVQQITRDMKHGEYEADSDYSSEEEDTPRIIELYDLAYAALTREPPATYVLPDETTMNEAHEGVHRSHTQSIKIILCAWAEPSQPTR